MWRKRLILVTLVVILAIVGVVVWRNQESKAQAAKLEAEILKGLSEEDIQIVLQSHLATDPQTVISIKENADARKAFLKKLRDTFALAAQARREGLAEDPNFKLNFEYKRNALLQALYSASMDKELLKTAVTAETIQAVWNDPENERQFNTQIDALRAIQKVYAESRDSMAPAPRPEGEKLEKARKEWAVTKIFSDRAKADAEFIAKPEIALRMRILDAGLLASDYSNKQWKEKIKASGEEIKAYLAAHPEYDIRKKRALAETVLQRVKSGEDFNKLALEFSEDRSTKGKGGLYENVGQGVLWAEVETIALSLQQGQLAQDVIETHNGFHIVKLEKRETTDEKNGGKAVKFSVRHIMLQKAFEEPNNSRPGVPPPFMKPEEIAKAEVEKEKYEALVADLVGRNQISLPDDFVVRLPEEFGKDALKGSGPANDIKVE